MDRLNRTLTGCGLALLLAAPGCKSAQSTVPPGRPYSSDGRQAPPIKFSSDPHPMSANANPSLGVPPVSPNGLPTSPGGLPPQFGTPAPNSGNLGAPTPGAYGGPGTSGVDAGPTAGTGSSVNPTGATSPLTPSQPGAPASGRPPAGTMGAVGASPSPL